MRAAAVKSVTWGLFEGSPDKLLTDIHKARVKRDQEESVHVLEEARKLYAQGKLKEAEALAHRAERLHGPYGLWDLSDRPRNSLPRSMPPRQRAVRPSCLLCPLI